MVYKVITEGNFKDWFHNHDEGRFSDEALEVLYSWYDEPGQDYEFDGVGIACSWTEYDNFEAFQADGNKNIETMEQLTNETIVLHTSKSIIVLNY